MAKVKLTAVRIAKFQCDESKAQAFLWCDDIQGLAIRATPGSTRKRYIFESKVNGKTVRMTIGEVSVWSIDDAKAEARRLQVLIDNGFDPRQVKADAEAAKEAEAAALEQKRISETVTVAEAWQTYVAERSASMKDGKPEWGDKHRACHIYFVQPGGKKCTSGLRKGQTATRPGVLLPLMKLRLADLDAMAIAAWLDKEAALAPASVRLAFSALRAFIVWCAKHDAYSAAVHADACHSDEVKRKVPSAQTKKNDSLRRAQIRPWFEVVKKISNPVIAAYLQGLLLTGARRNELAALRWDDVDFQWKSMTIRDKIEGERTIPLTPYLEQLISALPRRKLTVRQIGDKARGKQRDFPNEFVFSSPTAASGRLEEPRKQHNKALTEAALPPLSLHGLRRSFGTLSEWVEVPVGIVAQIMGHKPSAIAEKHYIQRELDLLHLWHVKIEAWILKEAEIKFVPKQPGLRVVK